ncbi:MAG: hypothetical protein ACYC75_03430 [Minisyncoccota bacterium]
MEDNDNSQRLPSDKDSPSKPRSFFDSLWWRITIPFIVTVIIFIFALMAAYNKYPPASENNAIFIAFFLFWMLGDGFLGSVVYWEVNEKKKWIVILTLILWNVISVPIIASYLHIHL